MKANTITITRIADGKVSTRTFKTKKEMQRFLSNNYTVYTWKF